MVLNYILVGCPCLILIKVIVQFFECKIPERVLLNGAISICRRFSKVSHRFEEMCGLSFLAIFTFWVFTLWHATLVLYSKRKSSITAPAPLTTKLISKQARLNVTESILVLWYSPSLLSLGIHFSVSLACYYPFLICALQIFYLYFDYFWDIIISTSVSGVDSRIYHHHCCH